MPLTSSGGRPAWKPLSLAAKVILPFLSISCFVAFLGFGVASALVKLLALHQWIRPLTMTRRHLKSHFAAALAVVCGTSYFSLLVQLAKILLHHLLFSLSLVTFDWVMI